MERNIVLDKCRGIAISTIAIFHMTRGFVSAGKMENTYILTFLDSFAHSFHVQIFFIISGFFLSEKLNKIGDVIPRILNLYYPYLLWSFLSAFISRLFSGSVNNSIDISDIYTVPLIPILHYWFLIYLIIMIIFLFIFRKIILIAFLLTFFVNAYIVIFHGYTPNELSSLRGIFYWGFFFFFGSLLKEYNIWPRFNIFYFVIFLFISLLSVTISANTGIFIRESVFLISSLFSCYILYYISASIHGKFIDKSISYLGKISLAIYLSHVIFGSGARIILYKIYPDIPLSIAICLCIIVSILGPTLFYMLSQKFRFDKIIGFSPLLAKR